VWVGLAAVALVGCSIAASPSGTDPAEPSASPSAAPAASPSPAPSVPADLPLTASVVQDGIRLTATLQTNPLRAGHTTWVDLEVKNVGKDAVTWLHDGCAIPAGVNGQMDQGWRPGVAQSGPAQDFKNQIFRSNSPFSGDVRIEFTDAKFVDRGLVGCADIGIQETLLPGEARHTRAQWNGLAAPTYGPPPSGPITLRVRAGYYWRASRGNPGGPSSLLEVDIPAWIVNETDAYLLDPPEVVDAALRDAGFLTWITHNIVAGNQPAWSGREPLLWFDPTARQWHVEVITYCGLCPGGGTIHGVLIDPATGAAVGVVDHRWDGSFAHHP
jgi:hypothetical protein